MIGKGHAELDALLLGQNRTNWSYLTAWNPRSRPLNLETNRARNRELLSMVQANANYTVYLGVGVSPDGKWSEESFLVLGMSEECAKGQALHFEQNAFVCGVVGASAKLVLVDYP